VTDVVPDGYTTLPEAVRRLAADLSDRTISLKKNQELLAHELGFPDAKTLGTETEAMSTSYLTWAKRQLAVWKMREALGNNALVSFVRDPVSGEMFRITADDWWGATFWRDTIVGGEISAQPGELIARYAGRLVLVEITAAEAWLASAKAPTTMAAANDCLSWLIKEMRASPHIRPHPKAWYRDKANKQHGVSAREFDRRWTEAIREIGATVWGQGGRPKSAR
jgi:hypothetical protein